MEDQVEGHHVVRLLKHLHRFSHQTEQAEEGTGRWGEKRVQLEHKFVQVIKCICPNCKVNFSKLQNVFV